MKLLRFYAYNVASQSVKMLRAHFPDSLCVMPDGNFRPAPRHIVINWGNPKLPQVWDWNENNPQLINHPLCVALASNKVESFREFEEAGIPTVDWTQDPEIAVEWIEDGQIVLARALARGCGGRGIIVLNPEDGEAKKEDLIHYIRHNKQAFFARYQKHSGEYRVHVAGGKVIDYVKKKKMDDEKIKENGYNYCKYVRNHDRGWVFARCDVQLPEGVGDLCVKAVEALGLDFGAVDVVYSQKKGAFILEINTAPGIEGTTFEKYCEYFNQLIKED